MARTKTQKRKQTRKQQRKQQSKPGQRGFFKQCADIAIVINLLLPIIVSIILIVGLFYSIATKQNHQTISMILMALLILFVSMGITILLYRYFPSALCVLFIWNVLLSFYSLAFVPK